MYQSVTENTNIYIMLLWAFFGYVAVMDCNIQKIIYKNTLLSYFLLFVSCFFLFTLPSIPEYNLYFIHPIQNKDNSFKLLILRSCLIFIFLVLFKKCKWQFSIITLILLTLNEFIKVYSILKLRNANSNEQKQNINDIQSTLNLSIGICIWLIVISGSIYNFAENYDKDNNFFMTPSKLKCS